MRKQVLGAYGGSMHAKCVHDRIKRAFAEGTNTESESSIKKMKIFFFSNKNN